MQTYNTPKGNRRLFYNGKPLLSLSRTFKRCLKPLYLCIFCLSPPWLHNACENSFRQQISQHFLYSEAGSVGPNSQDSPKIFV